MKVPYVVNMIFTPPSPLAGDYSLIRSLSFVCFRFSLCCFGMHLLFLVGSRRLSIVDAILIHFVVLQATLNEKLKRDVNVPVPFIV